MDELVNDKDLSYVSSRMGVEWRRVGLGTLNLTKEDLDCCMFGRNQLSDVCFEMLRMWKVRTADKATKRTLIHLLQDAPVDAQIWQKLLEDPSIFRYPLTLDDKIEILNNDLEKVYNKMQVSCKLTPWRDEAFPVQFVFSEVEITRTTLCPFSTKRDVCLKTYSELLTHRELKDVKRLLLEGDPGTGKTTTSLKILHDWLNLRREGTKSPMGIDAFIFLQMKYLRTELDISENIKTCLLSPQCCLTAHDINQIIESNKKVFILCDGFDELSKTPSKFLAGMKDLMYSRRYQDVKCLITSRRFSKELVKAHPNAKLWLNGFSKEQTKAYIIQKVFQEDPPRGEAILKYIEDNGLMQDIGKVPLLLALFCELMKTEDGYGELDASPDKMTHLFSYLLQCLFIHEREKRKRAGETVFSEDDLKLMVKKLGEVAFCGIVETMSLVWEKTEFVNNVGKDIYNMAIGMGLIKEESFEGCEGSGPRTPTQSIRKLGMEQKSTVKKVSFYHKLFQEKLAAEYFSYVVENKELLPVEDMDNFASSSDASELRYFLRFCCGEHPEVAAFILRHMYDSDVWHELIIECLYEAEDAIDGILSKNRSDLKRIVERICCSGVTITGDHTQYFIRAASSFLILARKLEVKIPHAVLKYLQNDQITAICTSISGLVTSLIMEPTEGVHRLLESFPSMPGLTKLTVEFFPFNNEHEKLSALQWAIDQSDLQILE